MENENEIAEEYANYLRKPSKGDDLDRIFGAKDAEEGGNYFQAMGFYAGFVAARASAHNSDYTKLYKEHNFRYCPYCGSSLSESYKCGCCNFA